MPRSRAARATARYIKPVSRNGYPSFSASRRPIVLFPEAAEPSTAITRGTGRLIPREDASPRVPQRYRPSTRLYERAALLTKLPENSRHYRFSNSTAPHRMALSRSPLERPSLIRPAAAVCALVAAVMLARPHSAGASELLINGGFEEGTAGWSTNAGQLASVSSPLHGGSQAARFSGSGQPTTQFAYQLINVEPASNYELSGWVAAPASGVSRLFLRVSWFDASGSLVLSADSPWLAQPDSAFHPLATGPMVSPVAARQAHASILIQADSP